MPESTFRTPFEKGFIKVGHGPWHDKGKGKPSQGKDKFIKLYFEKTGDGPIKILLIAGFGSPGSSWEAVLEYFSARPQYTVVIFDSRGSGMSDAPFGLYSTSQMAVDVLHLLNSLDWTADVNVAGISMGGMVALELALADRSRFSSLILTSTSAGRSPPPWATVSFLLRVITIRNQDKKMKFLAEYMYPKAWLDEPAPERLLYKTNLERATMYLKKQYVNLPLKAYCAMNAQSWAMLTHYVSPVRLSQLRASGIAILVVTGTDDNFVRPSGSYYLQQQLECKLAVFEGSRHFIPMERTAAYCGVIEELIQKTHVKDGYSGQEGSKAKESWKRADIQEVREPLPLCA